MARGALKGLKRTRPSAGEKVVVKGQLAQGGAGRTPGQNAVGAQGGVSSPNAGAELDNAELVSWLNCECFFSLVLVGLLAALPFNLHTQELMQTPETYVARALELSEDGAFDKAASLYERAVNIEETAERHVLLGEALVLAERKGEALWHYGRAADLYDDREYKVSTLVSLGQVQTEEGYSDDAVETYLQVLSLQQDEDPDEVADAHVQVAMSMLDSHNHSEAVGHLELATALVPDLTQAQELLANTLRDMGSVEEAIRRYKSIIAQRSTDIGTLVQLGYAYHELCDFSQALAIYKKARSSPTKAAEMDYLTAALHSKSLRPSRAPTAYVADLFDLEARKNGFLESQAKRTALASGEGSDSSESSGPLAEARRSNGDRGMFYDVHGLIFDRVAPNMRSMIEAALGLPTDGLGRRGLQWLDILDLGCGRGTMGSQLKPLANFITGVDLSERAIKHALREGSYDSIQHGDAIAVVNTMLPNSFDLVVAADMVPYFGDLGDLLRAIAAVTRPGGLVAFNADALDAIDDGPRGANAGGNVRAFDLKFTGRWSHRRKYVTQSVAAAGLSVLGVRVVKGRTRLVSTAAGEIVLEAAPQERRTTIFLCGKSTMT